jgi:hypothetical protein
MTAPGGSFAAPEPLVVPEGTDPAIDALVGKSPFDLTDGDIDCVIAYYQEAAAKGHFHPVPPKPVKSAPKRRGRKATSGQADLFAEDGP